MSNHNKRNYVIIQPDDWSYFQKSSFVSLPALYSTSVPATICLDSVNQQTNARWKHSTKQLLWQNYETLFTLARPNWKLKMEEEKKNYEKSFASQARFLFHILPLFKFNKQLENITRNFRRKVYIYLKN